jgi:peptidoglycan/LPS O-acetylase OafA/YrhL
MSKKFLTLETYRAFAALMIAAIHFDVNSPLVNHSLANGYFVQFFFVLVGLLFIIIIEIRLKIIQILKYL